MPPKKSASQRAAEEQKKKNNIEAMEIVANLMRPPQKTVVAQDVSTSNTAILQGTAGGESSKKSLLESLISATNAHVKTPPKKTTRRVPVVLTKKSSDEAKNLVLKPGQSTQRKTFAEYKASTSSKTTNISQPVASTFKSSLDNPLSNDFDGADVIVNASKEITRAKPDLKRKRSNEVDEMEAELKKSTQPSSSRNSAAASKTNKVHGTSSLKATVARAYVYEIDCKKVVEHINVIDLQQYLQKELKVNGSKNNLVKTLQFAAETR